MLYGWKNNINQPFTQDFSQDNISSHKKGMGLSPVISKLREGDEQTYRELVEAVGGAIGRKRRIIRVSPGLGYAASSVVGWFMRDTFITREEIKGLMDGLLYVEAPPAGPTRLTVWMRANAETLGRHYASEMARRQDRQAPYFPA